MKNLLIVCAILLYTMTGYSQVPDSIIVIEEKQNDVDNDSTLINIAGYKLIIVEKDNNESVTIINTNDKTKNKAGKVKNKAEKVKNKAEKVKNKAKKTREKIKGLKRKINGDDDDIEINTGKSYKTRSNWGGLTFGLTTLTPINSNIKTEEYLSSNTGTSWGYEFLNFSVPLWTPYASFTTGLGYKWDTYKITKNNLLIEKENGELSWTKSDESFDKNILRDCYFEIPLMLNFSTSTKRSKNVKFSIGYIQKLGHKVKTKTKTKNGVKSTTEGDFGIRNFNGTGTVRIGYKWLNFFANYGINSLFENKVPFGFNQLTFGMTARVVPVLRWGPKYHSKK